MFGSEKKIKNLEEEIKSLKRYISDEICLFKKKVNIDTEQRLVGFHKEISDRYFNSLENIFRFHKEIGLIDRMAGQVKDKDFEALKSQLMQPILESRWKAKEISDGEKIVNNGQLILKQYKDLQGKIIHEEKQGNDITKLKEQIKTYEKIMETIQ